MSLVEIKIPNITPPTTSTTWKPTKMVQNQVFLQRRIFYSNVASWSHKVCNLKLPPISCRCSRTQQLMLSIASTWATFQRKKWTRNGSVKAGWPLASKLFLSFAESFSCNVESKSLKCTKKKGAVLVWRAQGGIHWQGKWHSFKGQGNKTSIIHHGLASKVTDTNPQKMYWTWRTNIIVDHVLRKSVAALALQLNSY